jgi:SEL1 protein
MNGLGSMYRDGLGVAMDQNKALNYFQAASAENLAEAQVNLGRFYLGQLIDIYARVD